MSKTGGRAIVTGILVVWALFMCALFGFLTVQNTRGLVEDLTAEYVATTGEVVDEEYTKASRGSSRGGHSSRSYWRRWVFVEWQAAGESGTARLPDSELPLGATTPVWVDLKYDKVRLQEPTGPGFWQWTLPFLCAIPVVVSVVIAGRGIARAWR